MKTNIQILREEKNLTQSELAEKSGLSLRTVQRIEAGNIPKGFTLRSLADSLETDPKNLLSSPKRGNPINRAKLINVSALISLIIPFGNLIFPSILTYRSKEERAKELGKEILTIQAIYTSILGILLIISPFVQRELLIKFPLFLVILIGMKCINLYIILKNGASLHQKQKLAIRLKNSII